MTLTGGEISGSGTLTGASYDLQACTVSAALGGSGAMTKNDGGTVTLSGNSSTYSGAVTITCGSLVAANNTALGSGGVTMSDGCFVAQSGISIGNDIVIGSAGGTTTNRLRHRSGSLRRRARLALARSDRR